jgi:hypothetical protein
MASSRSRCSMRSSAICERMGSNSWTVIGLHGGLFNYRWKFKAESPAGYAELGNPFVIRAPACVQTCFAEVRLRGDNRGSRLYAGGAFINNELR